LLPSARPQHEPLALAPTHRGQLCLLHRHVTHRGRIPRQRHRASGGGGVDAVVAVRAHRAAPRTAPDRAHWHLERGRLRTHGADTLGPAEVHTKSTIHVSTAALAGHPAAVCVAWRLAHAASLSRLHGGARPVRWPCAWRTASGLRGTALQGPAQSWQRLLRCPSLWALRWRERRMALGPSRRWCPCWTACTRRRGCPGECGHCLPWRALRSPHA
jgi:hypothetical protein